MESRTKKSIKNIAYNLTNHFLTLLLSFISRSVFIYALGTEILGVSGLFSDILGLLSMADLGFGSVIVYSLYEPLANGQKKRVSALVNFYRKVYYVIAIVVALLGLLAIPFLNVIINVENDIQNIELYYLISLANIVLSYLFTYRTSILTADQNNYIIAKISMWTNIVKTVAQIVALLVWANYIVYLLIGLAFTVLTNIITSYVAAKTYPYIKEKEEIAKEEQQKIFKNIFSGFVYKVSGVLLSATDNLLISILVGTVAVGLYSNYLLIQNKISMVYMLFFSSITASVGNLIVKEKSEKRYEVFCIQQTISYLMCGIVVPCYMLLINDFVVLWLGKEFLFDNVVVAIIGFNMYLACVLQPLWAYREATGLFQKTKWIMVLCAFINLVLSVFLGIYMGIGGILLASCISRLLTYIWYEPILLFRKYFEREVGQFFAGILANGLLIVCLSWGLYVLTANWNIQSVGDWLLKAIMVTCISASVTFVFYRKSAGLLQLKNLAKYYYKRLK